MPGTGFMIGTLSHAWGRCGYGWPGHGNGPSYRRARRLERRAAEVLLLIREAFLRGLSTRAVGQVIALITDWPVSAQTVSRLTRNLDQAVAQFHQAPLTDDWRYLFLDGVSLRVRQPSGRKRVQLLVAYGVRADGTRHLLGFTRSTGRARRRGKGC